jgi:hypothetical protein
MNRYLAEQRESDSECGAGSFTRLNSNLPIMVLYDLLNYRKTKSSTFEMTRICIGSSVEAIEDEWDIFIRNANTLVRNFDESVLSIM